MTRAGLGRLKLGLLAPILCFVLFSHGNAVLRPGVASRAPLVSIRKPGERGQGKGRGMEREGGKVKAGSRKGQGKEKTERRGDGESGGRREQERAGGDGGEGDVDCLAPGAHGFPSPIPHVLHVLLI